MVKTVQVIDAKGLEIQGIGKLIIESKADWHIPHLHYIFAKQDGFFVSTNLELVIDGWGNSPEEAVENMVSSIIDYLNSEILSKEDFSKMLELVSTNLLDDFWREYRYFEMILAKEKRDLGHTVLDDFVRKMREDLERDHKNITLEKIEHKTLPKAS